jgi:spore maturation protein A
MITFVVMNTASLQLIPTTVAAMRRQAGAVNPMDIMPAIWIASAVSLAAGLALTGIFNSGKGMTAR